MTTVFLSGSRKISRLNDMIRSQIQNMLDQGFYVVIGDANGADKALQGYMAGRNYRNVSVFCAGRVCRNNVGDWDVREVLVDPKLKGRAFYTQKDKKMASMVDCGFVLWDGKSAGSINNVLELLKNGKKTDVYLWPEKRFVNVAGFNDLDVLAQNCQLSDYRAIRKTLGMNNELDRPRSGVQGELNLETL